MYLLIDTSDSKKIFILLIEDNVKVKKEISAVYAQEEKLLPSLMEVFKEYEIKKGDLKGIIVVKGPGSFSSLRVGLAVANALAWSWEIPIQGWLKSEFKNYEELMEKSVIKFKQFNKFSLVLPYYGREPNIG